MVFEVQCGIPSEKSMSVERSCVPGMCRVKVLVPFQSSSSMNLAGPLPQLFLGCCHGCPHHDNHPGQVCSGMWFMGSQEEWLGQLKTSLQCRIGENLKINFLAAES